MHIHKSKFWNIFQSLNKLFVTCQWAVTVSDFTNAQPNKIISQRFFLFLLVLIGWLTRFRKSQGYTHFKIYQFESSRLECLLRAKFLWTDTLDFIVFDPSHLITRPKIKIFRKLQNWFEFCWGWQEEREEKNIFLFAVEKVQSRPVSFWWCHNENAAHDIAAAESE